ncbi:MAG: nitrite/sulfite reductase [Nitrospirae bacterium]|nr:nitrite/sulfite reductase [Nitrospirota bacterium]
MEPGQTQNAGTVPATRLPDPKKGEGSTPQAAAEIMAPLWASYKTDEWGTARGAISELQNQEIANLESYIQRFLEGRMDENMFKPMRLYMGIYGQRQGGTNQMVRIKIPFGRLNADQLERIADVADTFAPRKIAHVTTRQDFQLHFVQLKNVPALLRRLAEAGVTTREACGNTVRNVTGCHRLGVCPTEPFDLSPYADVVSKFFLRNPHCKNLPRKFKIAFSGCPHDCAAASIHDIGIFAKSRDVDGKKEYGFRILAGGGLGAAPRSAKLLEEFIPVEMLLPTCAALVRVFNRTGNRKNRYRARMKFVIQTLGWEKFVQEVRKERDAVLKETLPTLPVQVPNPLLAGGSNGAGRAVPAGVDLMWFQKACSSQRQSGQFLVNLHLFRGDVTVAQMRGLVALLRRNPEIELRLTFQQNMALRNVGGGKLKAVHSELSALGLARADAESTMDVTVCPGADTCNLAKTHSYGLASQLTAQLKDNPTVNGYRIKISGCENACGQHQVADLGFYGCIRRAGGRIVPHYVIQLGGGTSEDGAVFGREIVKVPARRIAEAVRRLAEMYQKEKANGEKFSGFLRRVDKEHVKESIRDLIALPTFEENPDAYRDVGEEKDYEFLEKEGECAA